MFPGETILSGAVNDHHVSEFKVLESRAGHFIGTEYTFCGDAECKRCGPLEVRFDEGITVPNTRETEYFERRDIAEKALQVYKTTGELLKRRT